MKKIKFILFLLFAFLPYHAKAYGIQNYYIDATIEEDGDILVQEYFELNGSYNGYERIIEYANEKLYDFDPNLSSYGGSKLHNGDFIEVLDVMAVSVDSNFNFNQIFGDKFNLVHSASKGDYGVYEQHNTGNGISLLIYKPSSYNKAFYIKYRIKNIAIRHNDIAEIGWNLVGDQLKESVANLKAYIHIPDNINELRAWAHGPLNGEVNIVDKETIVASITGLKSYTPIDIRATFDLDVVSESTKTTNVLALDKILLYEEDKAEQANYERMQQEKIKQQKALYYLNLFEINISRSNYKNAKTYINYLPNSNIKNEYLNRLNITKIKLDEKEKNEAKDFIEYTKLYPSYENYLSLKEKINVIDVVETKEELLNELLVVEDIIKQKELKKEIGNYIIGIFVLGVSILLGYIVYNKYKKDPKTNFNEKYFREIPNDYSPEVVSYLFNKKISEKALSASVLNLIRKKVIKTEKISKNNYILTLEPDYFEKTNSIEYKIVKMIFGSSYKITIDEFKKNSRSSYSNFALYSRGYNATALSSSEEYNFYESDNIKNAQSNKSGDSFDMLLFLMPVILLSILSEFLPFLDYVLIVYILYNILKPIVNLIINYKNRTEKNVKSVFIVLFILIIYFSIYKCFNILSTQKNFVFSIFTYIISLILSIIFLFWVYNKNKRTVDGCNEYKKWKAFKNFLKDFGKFEDKEIIDIKLWEHYLVYATLFGCAKKIIKNIKVDFADVPNFEAYLELYSMNRTIINSVRKNFNSYSYSSSSNSSSSGSFSSGSGGGGGFSSGGGSFGGGGGGGRF